MGGRRHRRGASALHLDQAQRHFGQQLGSVRIGRALMVGAQTGAECAGCRGPDGPDGQREYSRREK